jgi:putative addiction module component (TIGR02574 family)
MKDIARRLLDEALTLSPRDRAFLAAELLATLDDDSETDIESAWAAEIESRAHDAMSEQWQGEAWDSIRDGFRPKR